VSSRPSWVGQVLRRTARWEAGRLILVTPEHESSHDGVRGVVTLTWERAG
jgi:hypothetical protein